MNLLTSTLPETVEVRGAAYPVNTDFRVWIRFGELASDVKGNCAEMLILCYKDALPPSLSHAMTALVDFYLCGKRSANGSAEAKTPIVSFTEDAEYIYSAYLNQYQIDLTATNLHWYQFMALFKALDDECKMSKIMEARAVNLSSIKDKNMKAYYRKMKRAYRLPDNRTEEQKERDMIAALESAF